MSNEIAVQQFAPLPQKIEHAKALAESGMIPRIYQKSPANVLVAIELGEALGIRPIVAINEINVISGTPAPSASLMASLARNAGHKLRVTGDDKSATCTIIRADDPDFEHTATWDVAKAKSAGLWGKGHWGKDSATMLKWRAISECVRFACSEVLGGLKYTPEEVADFASSPQRVTSQRTDQPVADPLAAAASAPVTDTPVMDLASYQATVDAVQDVGTLRGVWDEESPRLSGDSLARFTQMVNRRKSELEVVSDDESALDAAYEAEIVE